MTKLYAIYGASGCGRSLMPVARQQLARESDASEIVFIDDALESVAEVNGHRAMNYLAFLNETASEKYVQIAIANSHVREKIAQRLKMDGIQLWSIIADHVVLMDQLELDEGSALSPFVTIGSNVRIGKCFQSGWEPFHRWFVWNTMVKLFSTRPLSCNVLKITKLIRS